MKKNRGFVRSLLSILSFGQAPDQAAEAKVELFLRGRGPLNKEEWAQQFGAVNSAEFRAAGFLHTFFRDMQDLDVGRFRPSDRLIDDLHLNDVLWSDWVFDLGEETKRVFGLDPFRSNTRGKLESVNDLVAFISEACQQVPA